MFRIQWPIVTKQIAIGLVLILLNACANISSPQRAPLPANSELEHCQQLYQAIDRAINDSDTAITPSRPARVIGFPYLRVDRFLSSYREQNLNPTQLAAWLQQMAHYDLEARSIELAALIEKKHSVLDRFSGDDPEHVLRECSSQLQRYDLAEPERIAVLRRNALVPSEYLTLNQILGLYPLSSIPVGLGVRGYHKETFETFAQALSSLPIRGELRRFGADDEVPAQVSSMNYDTLAIPHPTPQQLQTLFIKHAPIWEVDVVGDFDLPGTPVWRTDGTPTVDTSEPSVYRYISYTRWRNEVLLQLNYMIWFSERPRQGRFDILGGPLDGLLWRVTLKADGKALIYDTIHPCGCYHYFFPTTGLALRAEALSLPEPPLVPQTAPSLQSDQRMVIRVESGTHYIQRIYADNFSSTTEDSIYPYAWRDYRELYISSVGDGKRSLFAKDGLVKGSERSERWILWPMGIPSAGAMRERGRHAVAFVGRRHFDDAHLFEQLFQVTED